MSNKIVCTYCIYIKKKKKFKLLSIVNMSDKRNHQSNLLDYGFKIKSKSQYCNQKNCDKKIKIQKFVNINNNNNNNKNNNNNNNNNKNNNNNNNTLTQIFQETFSK